MFLHQAYGLSIQLEYLFTELQKSNQDPDVYIKKGKVKPPPLEPTSIYRQGKEAYFGGNAEEAYLRWNGIATLLAKNGDTLIVDCDSDAIDPDLLSLYLLSEALGLILYQRGLFLLHACAVKIRDQVVIFAGPPGAGKSTTSAAFAKLGYTVLADDMVMIDLRSKGKPLVYPAFSQIKIWPSAIAGLNYNPAKLAPLFPGSKKQVIHQKDNFPTEPFPLVHIFFLETGTNLNISKIQGTDTFFSLAHFFPLPSALLQGVALQDHFQKCIDLANRVETWKLEKPQNFQILGTLIDQVVQMLDQPPSSLIR